jgi:hypothetical protein
LASANPVPEDETEDEKEVAAAAHPSAQAAGAPWVLVKKNGTVEAVDNDVRSADMAACKQSVSVSGKDKGDEDGDPFSCVECPWCPKAFKGIQYVVRHVQTKHSRNLVAVASGYVAICPSII